LAAAASYVVSHLLTPVYRASATVLVNETQVPGTIAYNDILTSGRTYRLVLGDFSQVDVP